MTDRLTGVIGLILALAYGIAGSRFHSDFLTDPLGPNAFPVMLALVLGAFSLVLLVRRPAGADWPSAAVWLRKATAIGGMIVYGFLLEPIGFPLASFLFVSALAYLMGGRLGPSLGTGLAASIGLYVLFDPVLGLPLPLGAVFEDWLGA
ncbi:MAG TPA: tripartite tricarboxylate transporter TctB family protein [Kiloniellales bacterium]|nr:tripartite tricarboxylate transporter TctB family protein [Kiloniellales bacterium]